MIEAVIAFSYALFPGMFDRLAFYRARGAAVGAELRRLVVWPIGLILLMVAWYSGQVIKMQPEDFVALATDPGAVTAAIAADRGLVEGVAVYGLARITTDYYSVNLTFDPYYTNGDYPSLSALTPPINELLYRLGYFLPGVLSRDKPDVRAVADVNYRLLSENNGDRTGAGSSPGPLATFSLVFPFPLSVGFAAVYLLVVSWIIGMLLRSEDGRVLSLFGIVIVQYWLRSLFQSPLDYIIFVDTGTLALALYLGMAFYKGSAPARRLAPRPRAIATGLPAAVAAQPSVESR